MERGRRYVIALKNNKSVFYFLHENKKEISTELTSIEEAMRFSYTELFEIRKNFPDQIKQCDIHEIKFTI